ncbi:aromatic motif membrane protein [Mycoplasma crocodyli]|uniref:aromatic motif membrane protein n=1 Tax=Mycoplasma crocodyli TaxID=50052 RepID=UPI0002ED58BC|nr:aromatic motif membrane protein [Mycoplasma crocodyli]
MKYNKFLKHSLIISTFVLSTSLVSTTLIINKKDKLNINSSVNKTIVTTEDLKQFHKNKFILTILDSFYKEGEFFPNKNQDILTKEKEAYVLNQDDKDKFILEPLKKNLYYFNGITLYAGENKDPFISGDLPNIDNKSSEKEFKKFIVNDWYLLLKNRESFNWLGVNVINDFEDNSKLVEEITSEYKIIPTSNKIVDAVKYDYKDDYDELNYEVWILKFSDNSYQKLNIQTGIINEKKIKRIFVEPIIFKVLDSNKKFIDVKIDDIKNVIKDKTIYEDFKKKHGTILTYLLKGVNDEN